MNTATATRDDHLIAGFAALAIAIHIIESAFPSPLPGVKPGLANVVTLIVLFRHGLVPAIWVAGLRVVIGSLLLGTFPGPTFVMAFSGAAAATAVLALVVGARSRWPVHGPGPVGASVAASLAHMSAQIAVAYVWLVPHSALLKLAPILLTASLLFGIASGIIAQVVLTRLSS